MTGSSRAGREAARIEPVTAHATAGESHEIAAVYAEAFREPRWSEADHQALDFRDRWLPDYVA